MELIKIFNESQPKFETTLPFVNQKVIFNAFKVKDSKKITIVLQEENKKTALLALFECLFGNSDYKNLQNICLADAEYLFLQMRAKSVDEYINVVANGNKVKININEIQIKNKIQTKTIKVGNETSITLTTPSLKKLMLLDSLNLESYSKACIQNIIVKGQVYDVEKFVPKDFIELIDNLPLSLSKEINNFVIDEPKLVFNVKTENGESEVSGLLSFFI